jgi:lipoprotein-anchoring transpeptidase ErfK/SrfK
MRLVKWLVPVLVLLAGLAVGGLAWADHRTSDRLARGTMVGGVAVGEMTERDAVARVDARVGSPAREPVRVKLRGRKLRLTAEKAGVTLDIEAAVHRAFLRGREGSFVDRGLRQVRKEQLAIREPIRIAANRKRVDAFVSSLAQRAAEAPVDAQFELSVDRVAVIPGQPGRRLGARSLLTKRLMTALQQPGGERELKATTVSVPPAVNEQQLWDQHPTVVTVSHARKRATVFERGEAVKTYHVAVGDPKYPTPDGQFVVQSMQKNPTWNVPQSEWAGDLAGKTIPGGDPRNPLVARWIGFNGSVGFHGTKDLDSLGRAASHGCVRMDPRDVKDLYTRVGVGTTVLVGA